MSKKTKFVCCDVDPKNLQNLGNVKIPDDAAIDILKKIAHPIRLEILRILLINPDFCTCDLEKFFDESQPIISRQLSILTSAEILERQTLTQKGVSGRWHVFRINPKMLELITHITFPFTREWENRKK